MNQISHQARNVVFFIYGMMLTNCLASCNIFSNDRGSLSVKQGERTIEIDNGQVRLLLSVDSPALKQKYFAKTKDDWTLVAESLQQNQVAQNAVLPLYKKGSDVAENYRLLANDGLYQVKVVENTSETVKLLLTCEMKGKKIQQTIELGKDQDHFHIEVSGDLGSDRKLEYLLSSFTFAMEGEPDYTFVPAVKRSNEDVVGDRKFFAPAAIVEKSGFMLSLVPDLDLINENIVYGKGARPQVHPRIFAVPFDTSKTSFPVALDLDLQSGVTNFPVIAYGFIDYWTEQHVYWRHENEHGKQVRELSNNQLKYGFNLFINSGVQKGRGYQRVSSFLWEKYGHRYLQQPKPQAMPFAEYAKVCYPAAFAYQGYEVNLQHVKKSAPGSPELNWNEGNHRTGHPELSTWQQWDKDGVPMGGLLLSAPQWDDLLYNTAWWNNAGDATGIYFWGKRLNDAGLIDKARRIINFTLSAPQQNGMFPSLYDIKKKKWVGSLWNPPMENYKPDSTANYWDWVNGAYQTASASVTAGFLLKYRTACEDQPGIVDFVKRYGDFLVSNVQDNGCVPAWFNKDLKPLPSMRWNADGGAHIWVLSELYKLTKDQKYRDAAEKMAMFMTDEVIPHQKWYDFETFYSCASKPETFFDRRTGQYPANNMAVSWALEGFASLYEITHNNAYLKTAEAVADYSIFYQAVWAPHYIITAYPYGGFSSQNSDAEWLDQRSHRFADGLVRVGLLSVRQDLLERAVAATRSSLTLVNHPRHIENDIYKFPNFPLGLGPENIDHEGFPQMPLRSGPSWCEVGGLAAASHLIDQLGGVYVDVKNDIALGIDAVSVSKHSLKGNELRLDIKSLLSGLRVPYEQAFRVDLHVTGLENKDYNLILNGALAVTLKPSELSKLTILIYPDNKIVVENKKT
jgi:hypothetical protein